jgi:uracil-DNA glycosylase
VETGPGCHNFYDRAVPANAQRRRNLEIYLQEMLDRRPKVLLVGEAPGFRGMRITGIPFTSRSILEGPANQFGLFGPGKGYVLPAGSEGIASEPTATVMWQVLAELDFLPLLWSACPFHTHAPGRPLSNRTPTLSETAVGVPYWEGLMEVFDIQTVVAAGNVAHRSLQRNGLTVRKIRHPAHGGRAGFKLGLQELLSAGVPQ